VSVREVEVQSLTVALDMVIGVPFGNLQSIQRVTPTILATMKGGFSGLVWNLSMRKYTGNYNGRRLLQAGSTITCADAVYIQVPGGGGLWTRASPNSYVDSPSTLLFIVNSIEVGTQTIGRHICGLRVCLRSYQPPEVPTPPTSNKTLLPSNTLIALPSSGLGTGAIIGIVIAGAMVLIIGLVALLFCQKKSTTSPPLENNRGPLLQWDVTRLP